MVVGDLQLSIGRNDVDVVGYQRRGFIDLNHRHAGAGGEDVREFAVVLGGQMDDDDEGDAGIVRQRLEECLQRLNPARRSADAGDGRIGGPLDQGRLGEAQIFGERIGA